MITILQKIFLDKNIPLEQQRGKMGMLCGFVGIFLNIVLFIGKFLVGFFSHSVAITADALNNLSDAGSSVVTLAGFKLAGQKPDSEHPYGHGRMEYIAGLIVSFVILLMAYELFKDAIEKMIHPESIEFSIAIVVVLVGSILVKCYMAFYNFRVGKQIESTALRATAIDSLSDCIATTVVLITSILGHYMEWQLDGVGGLVVACFITYAGIGAFKETIGPILGQAPDPEFIEQLEEMTVAFDDYILGVHDIMVHDYGPGRKIVSLHAEVPSDGDINAIHDVIDNLEYHLRNELGCVATIHMDPIAVKDDEVNELKEKTKTVIQEIDEVLSMHDFRVVKGETHTNLIFDVEVPFEFPENEKQISEHIQKDIWEKMGNYYFCVIQVDHVIAKPRR